MGGGTGACVGDGEAVGAWVRRACRLSDVGVAAWLGGEGAYGWQQRWGGCGAVVCLDVYWSIGQHSTFLKRTSVHVCNEQ